MRCRSSRTTSLSLERLQRLQPLPTSRGLQEQDLAGGQHWLFLIISIRYPLPSRRRNIGTGSTEEKKHDEMKKSS